MVDKSPEEKLAEEVGSFYGYPLDFVLFAYPWGQPGMLDNRSGPLDWQAGFLREWGEEIRARGFDGVHAVAPIMFSTVSGHGIGKSAMSAFITDFIMSTRPFSKGVVTANTQPQLETKTWAEIAKWTGMLINKHWFKITSGRGAMKMVHADHPESWRVDGLAWRETRAEAFAGQHAANSTSWYLFDEASAIPEIIFETAKGGLTDGEPMQFMFGNGTKASGHFFDSHNRFKHRYKCRNIDSRSVEITNKEYLEGIIEDYGEDSDTAKIRVLGKFPNRSLKQFIPTDVVRAARKRKIEEAVIRPFPLLMGVDVARFGDDKTWFVFRKGRSATILPHLKFEKLDTVEVAEAIARVYELHKPDHIFVDGAGVGGGVVDNLRNLRIPGVLEINFGTKANNSTDFRDVGTECWDNMATWFGSEVAIPDHDDLESQLVSREYGYLDAQKKYIEPKKELKKRGLPSPDWADALALTFAIPVPTLAQARYRLDVGHGVDYDPLSRNVANLDIYEAPYPWGVGSAA
jgi:hypothetical protein